MSLDKIRKLKAVQNDILKQDKPLEFISTGVGTLNILFSGRIDGGIPKGKVSMIAADSALGKSMIGLKIAKNAQKKGMNVIIFDTEKAFAIDTAVSMGIDMDKILVIQNTSLEEVTTQFMNITQEIGDEKDNYLFIIDSWNVLVSSKTVDDATNGKDVADLSTQKKKNTFAKLLLNSNTTVFVINQIYVNIMESYSSFSGEIPGGKTIFFASSSIVQANSKAKDKNTDGDIVGAIITAVTRKGRFVKEYSKLKYLINYDGGINPFYGLLDIALEGGFITKPTIGWYQKVGDEKKYREREIYNKEFWKDIISNPEFKEYIKKSFAFTQDNIIDDMELDI